MSDAVVVAYVPVLHEGYRRFLEAHGRDRPLYLITRALAADYTPLAKDIRALDEELVAASLRAWGICSTVEVLTPTLAASIAERAPTIILPSEDVSFQIVERFFGRCPVRYDTVFLRWDKTKTVQLLKIHGAVTTNYDQLLEDFAHAAEEEAQRSVDWWRQVGAAIRFADGTVRSAHNEHHPHRLSAYAAGDPRSNFFKGVGYDLSTATHAEARLIADAAREGRATAGAELYVTDFPCPACAKLIAAAGVVKLYFRQGYAVLDGQDVLEAAGVEILQAA